MNQNHLILLFCCGCIGAVIGFAHTLYLLTLIFIAFILAVFVYSDYKAWRESTRTDLKKNLRAAWTPGRRSSRYLEYRGNFPDVVPVVAEGSLAYRGASMSSVDLQYKAQR